MSSADAAVANRAKPATAVSKHFFGAYVEGSPDDGMAAFKSVQAAAGHKLSITEWFQDWSTPFNAKDLNAVNAAGSVPLVTWEPQDVEVADVASGKYDTYLRQSAAVAKQFNHPLYVRPFAEMNGSWETWNGNPKAVVAAWRHMVLVFRGAGAANVRWIWSPNETDDPATAANRMELYYPGVAYVDVLAFDGYNWGASGPNGWRTFDQITTPAYKRLAALGPQPIWIAEMASSPTGGNKAAWVSNMFTAASRYPRLQAIVWFNENKEQDWRLTADPKNAAAVRTSMPKWVN